MMQRLCVLGGLSASLLLVPARAGADEQKITKGWTAPQVMKALNSMVEGNWRPVAVKGYVRGDQSVFDITWERTCTTELWYIYLDMPTDVFEGRKAELDKKRYRVAFTNKWQVDGKERFAAIWYPK